MHDHIDRGRLHMAGDGRLGSIAMRMVGKSRRKGGGVRVRQPSRVRQCERRANSLHKEKETRFEEENSGGKIHPTSIDNEVQYRGDQVTGSLP